MVVIVPPTTELCKGHGSRLRRGQAFELSCCPAAQLPRLTTRCKPLRHEYVYPAAHFPDTLLLVYFHGFPTDMVSQRNGAVPHDRLVEFLLSLRYSSPQKMDSRFGQKSARLPDVWSLFSHTTPRVSKLLPQPQREVIYRASRLCTRLGVESTDD